MREMTRALPPKLQRENARDFSPNAPTRTMKISQRRPRLCSSNSTTSIALFVFTTTFFGHLLAQEKPTAPSTPPAEKASTTPNPPQAVDKIEVTTSQSGYDARQDDTATKIVVGAEEIKRYGDTQVLDVLKRLPGVTVLGNSIRLRGLGAGYTQILIDGDRPPPGFSSTICRRI